MTWHQTSLLHVLPLADGRYWVRVKAGIGHQVYQGGEEFVVIDDEMLVDRLGRVEPARWLTCWRDGIEPATGGGTLLRFDQVERL